MQRGQRQGVLYQHKSTPLPIEAHNWQMVLIHVRHNVDFIGLPAVFVLCDQQPVLNKSPATANASAYAPLMKPLVRTGLGGHPCRQFKL
jgi:hypothetical protein